MQPRLRGNRFFLGFFGLGFGFLLIRIRGTNIYLALGYLAQRNIEKLDILPGGKRYQWMRAASKLCGSFRDAVYQNACIGNPLGRHFQVFLVQGNAPLFLTQVYAVSELSEICKLIM